jgi:ATP-binding cassette subfamily C protein
MDKAYDNLFIKFIRYQKTLLSLNGLDGVVSSTSNILVYMICGIAIIKGNVTIGLFTVVLNLFGNMSNSIKFFLDYGKTYQETRVSYDRINAILNMQKEKKGTIQIDNCNEIVLKNIKFGYKKNIIDGFSYNFKKGNIYYIVGKNGAGKTTLINLILGNHIDLMDGEIFFDDQKIENIDLEYAKKNLISYAEQETFLISGTIKENLELFKPSDSNSKEYIQKLNLYGEDNKSNIHENTVVNVQQNNISGGEMQKISIIRQLILNTKVMIFDEPTSNLEYTLKMKFAEIIREIKKDKIIIIITHDRDIVSDEDIIINV